MQLQCTILQHTQTQVIDNEVYIILDVWVKVED